MYATKSELIATKEELCEEIKAAKMELRGEFVKLFTEISKKMITFVKSQFDQEARLAMILQIGNFKGNVIFCRILSWFLFFEFILV